MVLTVAACSKKQVIQQENKPTPSAYEDMVVRTYNSHSRIGPAGYSEYTLVAESDTYRLYYYEPRLAILLENKQTGVLMPSVVDDVTVQKASLNEQWAGYVQSGIVLNAIRSNVKTYQVDMNNTEHTISTGYYENGIRADISFPEYGISLAVQIFLENDQLVARVPDESIREEKENNFIYTIALFPFLGYTYLDEEPGYMLVPDGNGALIELTDKEGRYKNGFSGFVYGRDYGFAQSGQSSYLWEKFEMVTSANRVMAPFFGMAHTGQQSAYFGLVESGDERCTIWCEPNGVTVDFNRCYARFTLRDVFTQPMSSTSTNVITTTETRRLRNDLQVRYFLLSGEDANYSGMARTYQKYLLDNELIKAQYCGYRTRVDFLGVEQEDFLMGTKAVTMTTADNIREMYTQLQGSGVSSVLTVYKGWQKGGLYNLPLKGYKADSSIGGTKELTDLIRTEATNNYMIYLYDDGLTVNSEINKTTYTVMKMVNKRTYTEEVNGQVYDKFYYLMPEQAAKTLEKFVSQAGKEGVRNLALSGVTDKLFSYSSKGGFYSRTDTMNALVEAVAKAAETGNLVMEAPNAYMWPYMSAILDMPMGSSDYPYIDQEVPFLSMVLKGIVPMYGEYVNFKANKQENLLQMVETGIFPSFYLAWEDSSKLIYTNSNNLYSLTFSTYEDTVVDYDRELRTLASRTEGATITNHEILENGLVRVSYSNGVVIYVNYSEKDLQTESGATVAKLSYKVGDSQ